MSNDREEKIEQWIFQEGVKKERRKRIIPSSTEAITSTSVGTALDAMEKISFYFGDRPELPIVEMGLIKEDEITLTFGDDVNLDSPFRQVYQDQGDHWGITHQEALALSTGHVYGQQIAALTAVGNMVTGHKALLNTNRWHVLGTVGLAQWSTAIMVGQVMEQATEPWASEHHIWLVGYRDLGPKLVNFLTKYHDESYFHLVESVEQITADDLTGTTATLYVMGSNEASLKAYDRIRSERVGMFTDTVVTEQAMFISEDDDGGATILNATPDGLKVWPNLVGEGDPLYEAMELIWGIRQEQAQQAEAAVESLTIEDFLPADLEAEEEAPNSAAPAAPAGLAEQVDGSSSISLEELEALVNFESVISDEERHASTYQRIGEQAPTTQESVEEIPAEQESPHADPAQPAPEQTAEVETADVPADQSPTVQATAETVVIETVVAETAADETAGVEGAAVLSILGQPELRGQDGSTTEGKPAEAVAYLHLHGLSQDAIELSRALWPEAEHEGNTARIRRTRTAKKIKDALPVSFRNDTQWEIDPLATDLDQIITVLSRDGDPQETLRACQAIDVPLQGCAEWADEYRNHIVSQLRQVLDDTTDRALEKDQFEIAKAARQASKKL